LIAQLVATGHRVTPQRLATWRVLVTSPPHSSIHDLHGALRQQLDTTTLRTLYATVHLFEHLGLVRLLHVPGGARVELEPVDHTHGYCERCGMIVNLAPAARVESPGLFHPGAQDAVTYGLCNRCYVAETSRDTRSGGASA
jgi:Fe2+ or Zn2+ uptake regulation protein